MYAMRVVSTTPFVVLVMFDTFINTRYAHLSAKLRDVLLQMFYVLM